MNNPKISLILFVSGNYWQSEIILKETILKSGLKSELLIYNSDSSDKRVSELFLPIANKYIDNNDFPNKVEGLNHLLKSATAKNICVIPEEVIINPLWLIDLLYFYEKIECVGILTLPSNSILNKKITYTHAVTNDHELCTVMVSETMDNYGVSIYSKEILKNLGAYDESLSLHNAIRQYSFRGSLIGFNSYYTVGFSVSELNTITLDKLEEKEFCSSLINIRRKHQIFIQLYEMSILEEMAYSELDNIILNADINMSKFKLDFTGEFGLVSKTFDSKVINSITELCLKFNLCYSIENYTSPNNRFLLNSIVIMLKTSI